MKKVLRILLVIIIVVIMLLFLKGFGFGLGKGLGEGGKDSKVTKTSEADKTDSKESEKDSEETLVKVSVIEDGYVYDSEKIELEELIEKLNQTGGDCKVEVIDDKATKNAYDALIEALESNNIHYMETEKEEQVGGQ